MSSPTQGLLTHLFTCSMRTNVLCLFYALLPMITQLDDMLLAVAALMGVQLIFVRLYVSFCTIEHLSSVWRCHFEKRAGSCFGLWHIIVKIIRLTTCPTTVRQEHSMCQMTQNKIVIIVFAGMSPQQSLLTGFFDFTLQLL